MEIYQLKCFHETASAGTMSEAARRLNVSQPALSIAIRKLEDELGVDLFIRKGRAVAISAEGRTLLPLVDRLLSYEGEILRVSQDIASNENRLLIRVRDAMPLVIRVASRFHENHPGQRIRLMNMHEEPDVEADIVIDCVPQEAVASDMSVLLHESILAAIPRIMFPSVDVPVTLDFIRENQILGISESYATCENIRYFSHEHHMPVSPSIICTGISVLRNLLVNGTGISLVPSRSWLFQEIPSLNLFPLEGPEWRTCVTARCTGFRRNSEAVTAFMTYLEEGFAQV